MKKIFLTTILATLSLTSNLSYSQVNDSNNCNLAPQINKTWQILKTNDNSQLISKKNKKDNVLVFFNYACVHCGNFEPLISNFQKNINKQENSLIFQNISVAFNKTWEQGSRLYYSLISLKLMTDDLHSDIFKSIHKDKKDILTNKKELSKFLQQRFPNDFEKIINNMNSFSVNNKLKESENHLKNYNITGTPTVIFDLYNSKSNISNTIIVPAQLNQTFSQFEKTLHNFIPKECRDSLK